MEEGFLLIDKPKGPTSHDVVAAVRRASGVARVGHAGTLDPFATGLLVVGVGRGATREFPKFVGLDKDYEAEFVLGAGSDTDDGTGRVEIDANFRAPDAQTLRAAIEKLTGEIEQMPPAYSAVKVGGRKSYEAARKGEALDLKPRRVTISRFDLLSIQPLNHSGALSLRVFISCSSGTYIRALARDLGRLLNTAGHVAELRRTRIGPISIDQAVKLEQITSSNWQTLLLAKEDISL
jgi:tRNA pseudouridine55 synthase